MLISSYHPVKEANDVLTIQGIQHSRVYHSNGTLKSWNITIPPPSSNFEGLDIYLRTLTIPRTKATSAVLFWSRTNTLTRPGMVKLAVLGFTFRVGGAVATRPKTIAIFGNFL